MNCWLLRLRAKSKVRFGTHREDWMALPSSMQASPLME